MMKASVTLMCFATVSAFSGPLNKVSLRSTALHQSSGNGEMQKSQALPFANRPAGLDTFQLAGDKGFDPLNLASTKEKLLFFREAEVKHARLAMLATLGWIAGELFDEKLAEAFGLPALVVNPSESGIGLEPSLLNGGLGAVPSPYWILVVGYTAALEVQLQQLNKQKKVEGGDKQPGDYGFDPLGFF
eukprot:CAMPEP_0117763362 /NCGR_PEP_ID=MMETSP0947-20121206/18594_1 /TAXON_ID=44440 /ORGANISM="Chattonella subsalsa, Strain CCMP2191" /LENGTH=187 /DNA_ID=CAMNT_0005585057 /DNA_START=96 /DNA_END=656 /DNA_ORIENTATION=+